VIGFSGRDPRTARAPGAENASQEGANKRSALAWRNCAVSARGQMLRERTVGRFSRRVETAVIC
jgi:hypothetical protein